MCVTLDPPPGGLLLSQSGGKLQDLRHFNGITEIRPDTNGISCRGKCLSVSHTHICMWIQARACNEGKRRRVCLYVRQYEGAAISPPARSGSLSAAFTHLSAPLPTLLRQPVLLKDHDSWHQRTLTAPAFSSSVLTPNLPPPTTAQVCFFWCGVYKDLLGPENAERSNGVCDICLLLCVCAWYLLVGWERVQPAIHLGPI